MFRLPGKSDICIFLIFFFTLYLYLSFYVIIYYSKLVTKYKKWGGKNLKDQNARIAKHLKTPVSNNYSYNPIFKIMNCSVGTGCPANTFAIITFKN